MSVMPTTVTAESLLENTPEKLVSTLGESITIIGEIYRSNVIQGAIAVEVDFGTLYIPDDHEVMVFM